MVVADHPEQKAEQIERLDYNVFPFFGLHPSERGMYNHYKRLETRICRMTLQS